MRLVSLSARLHRRGLIGCGLLLGLMGVSQGPGYAKVAGTTETSRRAFAAQMEALGRQLSYMFPPPERAETVAGFIQWRAFGFYPLVLAFWAAVAAAGATRGDEERGLTEQWLATGRSRETLLISRVAGFALVAAGVVAAGCLGAAAGARAAGESLGLSGLALQGATLLALGVCCFALVALIAQFASTSRGAAGAGGVALLALFVLGAASRNDSVPTALGVASPFFHYDRVRGVVPGARLDAGPPLVLAVAALALTVLACVAFSRRDLGAALFGRRARRRRTGAASVPRNPLLRGMASLGLYEQRVALAVWAVGIAALALAFTSLARSVVGLLRATPALRASIDAASGSAGPEGAFVGLAVFGNLGLAVALFAATQTSRWVGEDLGGRLEMVLATPTPRRRVILARLASVLVAVAWMSLVGCVAVVAGASLNGFALPAGRVAAAGAMLVPLGASFAGIGAALSAFAPRSAVPALGAFAVVSYLAQQLGTLFRWPASVTRLSLFRLYGAPMSEGIYAPGMVAMVAITIAGFAAAAWAVERRDVGR